MLSNLPNATHRDKLINVDMGNGVLLSKTFSKHLLNIYTWNAWCQA